MTILDNVRLYRPGEKGTPDDLYHMKIEEGFITGIYKGTATERDEHTIDGRQLVVAPAFNDSHLHLLRYGLMKKELDLRQVTSWTDMKQIIQDRFIEEEMEENDWVIGRGVIDSQFTDLDHLLTAADLDELEYNKPMFLLHDDGHECIVNHKALSIIQENDGLAEGHDPFIEKDEDGRWTGRFKDSAVHFIKFHFRQKSKQEIYEAVQDAIPHLSKMGITSVHTDDLNYAGDYQRLWSAYTQLEKDGKLNIDVQLHHYVYKLTDIQAYLEANSKRTGDGTKQVKVGAFKIFLDGTQRLHTSALRQPYHDKPDTKGNLIYPQEELNEMVKTADQNGMQVTMHAIGDRAVEQAITALENTGTHRMRHRIIHAQVLAPDLLERLQQLKPFLETQPGFIMEEHDQTVEWVGKERERYCNPWATVHQLQIPFTGSSDSPIGPLAPLMNMFAAVNRTDKQDNPEGGWIPEEKLSTDAIFRAYSETPAWLEFHEHRKGKLKPGYQADFILLSDHPTEIQPAELKHLQVAATFFRGNCIYQRS
ncbi:amidohydrolase [Sediminibacillus dalangtanensis]|nr:amidohydrolase [Sediminibacillus dalangtanensis]